MDKYNDVLVDTNPKTQVGRNKPDVSLIPPVATMHQADAFMDGADKYGPYNWREKTVSIRTYIAAAKRHLDLFLDGEQVAKDSKVHHLGHAMACCAIMLDAMSVGNAIDDRPWPGRSGDAIDYIQSRRAEQKPNEENTKYDEEQRPERATAARTFARGYGGNGSAGCPGPEDPCAPTTSTSRCY